MSWQPIETAPKDGTVFIAYCPNGKSHYSGGGWSFKPVTAPGIVLCYWDDYTDRMQGPSEPLGWCRALLVKSHGGEGIHPVHPTIWQPLPPPPTELDISTPHPADKRSVICMKCCALVPEADSEAHCAGHEA